MQVFDKDLKIPDFIKLNLRSFWSGFCFRKGDDDFYKRVWVACDFGLGS